MALPHAASGQLIAVYPLVDKLTEARTVALFKTDDLEVMRLIVPAGKSVPSHQVKGEITVQCLEGEFEFTAHGQTQLMQAGQLLYLAGGIAHGLTAVRDSSVLVTLVLRK
ncbi:Cupin domain protein [Polaromonas sp. OV174]|uniref:cupin domain-containing protein n=1 Tax=Polaromonas sp. OV174 TaxID=1855300 RepID=UPI0008EE838C|nr:cupin domain-containing protein [Polaromonas sp. OV174]SFB68394.1 Cupin domain protein [Polaromonas sp. OV174]